MQALHKRYGLDAVQQAPIYLDLFFDYRRKNLSLTDYVLGFQQAYDEANIHCGLTINDIGLTHLFLKHSMISESHQHDYLLQLGGDRSRYRELKDIVLRMAKQKEGGKQVFP